MGPEACPTMFVGYGPDERLLSEDLAELPAGVGRPELAPRSRGCQRLLATGAALTGLTLVGGWTLAMVGLLDAVSGDFRLGALCQLVLGATLVGMHWQWLRLARIVVKALEARCDRAHRARRRRWLETIEPYTRWSVTTCVCQDGSIRILTARHLPTRRGVRTFTFVREITGCEVHSGEEPAATITERAEFLHRLAAIDTRRERQRFNAADAALRQALLAHDAEQECRAALHATSVALSDQINLNLRNYGDY